MTVEQIRPIATGRVGCLVSKMIRVAGHPVGFMYRKEPLNDVDSGWCFMAGPESKAFMDNPANYAAYSIDAIVNDDPEIIPLVDAPIGSAFKRGRASGRFVEMEFAPPGD
jgi:hypothetical protein